MPKRKPPLPETDADVRWIAGAGNAIMELLMTRPGVTGDRALCALGYVIGVTLAHSSDHDHCTRLLNASVNGSMDAHENAAASRRNAH